MLGCAVGDEGIGGGDSLLEVRVCRIVGELYIRASPVCLVGLKDEVHHAWAVGLESTVFVPQRSVSLAPRLLCLVGVVVDSLLH